MNEIRYSHGCTTTIFGNSKVVLVVGGDLDTMEMYDPLKNEWKLKSTRLPLPLSALQVVNSHSLNYLAYIIGGGGNIGQEKTIYGLSKTVEWKLVGNLKQKRRYHSSLNIRANDIFSRNVFVSPFLG